MFFCSKCKIKVPAIYISVYPEVFINSRCQCNAIEMTDIKTYLLYVNNNYDKDIIVKCIRHNNRNFEFYCRYCQKNLCYECKNEHLNHTVINLNDYKSTVDVASINNKIKIAKQQIKSLLLIQEQQTNQAIKDAYRICIEKNKMIISLVEKILEKYNNNNYFYIQNIIENCTIKIDDIPLDEESPKLISFLHRYVILQKPFVHIKELDTIRECSTKIILLSDGRLLSCCSGEVICIYKRTVCEIRIHIKSNIHSICQIEDGKIIIGSGKGIIIISLSDNCYKIEHIIKQTDIVDIMVPLLNNRFCMNYNKDVIIINGHSPYNLIQKLHCDINANNGISSIIKINNKELLYCISSPFLIIFDMETYQCVSIIKGFNYHWEAFFLQIDDNRILLVDKENLSVINIKHLEKRKIN